MIANATLLQKKYARIVGLYARKYHMSQKEALSDLYTSDLYHLISSGVSDLHCMSDDYLAEELHDELVAKATDF